MKNFLDNIKKFFGKDTINNITLFCSKNKRYFGAAALFIAMVLVLYNCTGKEPAEKDTPVGTETEDLGSLAVEKFELDEEFEHDTNEELNALITAYYDAYASDDIDTLEQIAYPLSNNEKSYIGVFSQYIEAYQNISCYSKKGLTEGSYLVSVYSELKFYGVDTPAPGLDFFYVETDNDGKFFINNLYSPYNLSRAENEMDPNIYSIILKYEQQDDVAALRQEVEQKYNDAVASDVNLAAMITTTIPNAMREWIDSVNAMEQNSGQTTEPETEQTTEPAESTEDTQTEEPESESEAEEPPAPEVVKVQVIDDSVNVRSGASSDTDMLGKANYGETYTKLGESGEWTQIDYNGTPAYIKTEFLQTVTN